MNRISDTTTVGEDAQHLNPASDRQDRVLPHPSAVSPERGRSRDRPMRPLTPARLEAVALRYLQRFSASREQVRRVLIRRLRKARDAGQEVPAAADTDWLLPLLDRLTRLGYLDDRRMAEGKARSLRRQGKSARVIRQALAERGLDPALIAAALENADQDRAAAGDGLARNTAAGWQSDPAAAADQSEAVPAELRAAIRLAQRRRLGPWRPAHHRCLPDQPRRDLAVLARAGFSRAIAEAALSAGEGEEGWPDGEAE